MSKNLAKLKKKVDRLNKAVKVFTGLSFGLLSFSLTTGITAFSLNISDNLKNKEKFIAEPEYKVYNPVTDGFKKVFYASAYSFIGLAGTTLIINRKKEELEDNMQKSQQSMQNNEN